ncbi:MAG: UDP-glucose 4-epimerase GalE, partial [Patescibacteria group bacterium]
YGHRAAVPATATLIVGDIGDPKIINQALEKKKIEAVIHFAGYISVEESVREPHKYFRNNVLSPIRLLEAMGKHGVSRIIFSSTAAVYGNPQKVPIPEDHPQEPLNPYGLSKWCFENLLKVYDCQKGLKSISLRYFNAAGASLDGSHGEDHQPETHIIPLALKTALGEQREFSLFGTDYPTRDGSCIRDYIHVEDLCRAHLAALDALMNGHPSSVYNVGTGSGVTNKEVLAQVKKETGVDFPVKVKPRRPGDAAELVADPTKLSQEFGWRPEHSDIATIIQTAWNWYKNHPQGYADRR